MNSLEQKNGDPTFKGIATFYKHKIITFSSIIIPKILLFVTSLITKPIRRP